MKKSKLVISLLIFLCLSIGMAVVANAFYYPQYASLYSDFVRSTGTSYAEQANPDYKHFEYDDSTNFLSQCIFIGGVSSSASSSYKDIGESPEKNMWYHVGSKSVKSIFNFKLYYYKEFKYSSTWMRVSQKDEEKGYGFYEYMTECEHIKSDKYATAKELIDNAVQGDGIIVLGDGEHATQCLYVTDAPKYFDWNERYVLPNKNCKDDVKVSAHSSEMKSVSFTYDIDSYYRLKNPNVQYILIHVSDVCDVWNS